jgi:hypothetical protein
MAGDDHRLVPMRNQARHVLADDRFAENRAVENVADGPVRRLPHLLEAELFDAGLVGRNRRALHSHTVLARGVGGINRDLIARLVAGLDTKVEVFQVDIEIRQDELLANLLPDDARHLVAVHLDDGILDLDLRHENAPVS